MELFSHKAEQIVLGNCINRQNLIGDLARILTAESFYYDKHKYIWKSFVELSAKGVVPDVITISDDLEKKGKIELVGGSSYILELFNASVDFSNTEHYADIIKNKEELRYFYELFSNKSQEIQTGTTTDASKIISEISDKLINFNLKDSEKNTSISEISREYTKLQENYVDKKSQGLEFLGIPTKYASLDRATEGFQPECLWTVAAFTSVGKTTYMMNLIKKLLDQGKNVCVFSLEMSKEDLFSKLLALELEMSPVEITKGLLNNDIYKKQLLAKQKYIEKKLSVYTECINVEDIVLTMKGENLKEHVDVFFIDYVQNVSSEKSSSQFSLINTAVKEIQAITRKLKTTTVILSQISNESNKSGGVLEVGGKDAGAIRAASNVFIYLKRDGTEEEILERYKSGMDVPIKLILNKNRMGRIGSFNLNLKQKSGIMYEPI